MVAVTAAELRSYLYVLVCRTAGEAVEYDEFLSTQVEAGCDAARKLQSDCSAVEEAQQHVENLLLQLQRARQTRIVGLCDALRDMSTLPDRRVQFWNICSLSGVPTHDCMRIETPVAVMFVDYRYAAFMQCFWLNKHMSQIEAVRMQNFLAHQSVESSLATQIQQYTSSTHAASESDCQVYTRALQMVLDTLQATVDGLSH